MGGIVRPLATCKILTAACPSDTESDIHKGGSSSGRSAPKGLESVQRWHCFTDGGRFRTFTLGNQVAIQVGNHRQPVACRSVCDAKAAIRERWQLTDHERLIIAGV